MTPLFFDIETEPQDDDSLRAILPPFDPEEVALGNTKDPAKVAAKIAEAEAGHFDKFKEKAALSAATGRLCAIGLSGEDVISWPATILDCSKDEKESLIVFWETVDTWTEHQIEAALVGFNIKAFDLPFLIRRSWVHGIRPPTGWFIPDWKWWSKTAILDLREMWLLGDSREKSSLNHVAKALGLGQKTGDHGHNFGALWRSTNPSDRALAEEYLRQDVLLNRAIFQRITHGS